MVNRSYIKFLIDGPRAGRIHHRQGNDFSKKKSKKCHFQKKYFHRENWLRVATHNSQVFNPAWKQRYFGYFFPFGGRNRLSYEVYVWFATISKVLSNFFWNRGFWKITLCISLWIPVPLVVRKIHEEILILILFFPGVPFFDSRRILFFLVVSKTRNLTTQKSRDFLCVKKVPLFFYGDSEKCDYPHMCRRASWNI